jgi:hypothetical protein
VKLVTYTPDHFPLVARAAASASGASSLGHRPFVDYYYATRDWCRLYFVLDRDEVQAMIGIEQVPFEYEGTPVTLACGSNLATVHGGAGGLLFLHWVRSGEFTCVFGGSDDMHRLVRSQRWTYFHGIRVLRLNRSYVARADEAWWRAAAKRIAQTLRPRVDVARRARAVATAVQAIEEPAITADMLPVSSPFTLRMNGTIEYLDWRYAGDLSFVRYRHFRLVTDRTCGYVIINDKPDAILVAQADADDPTTLATGIIAAIGRVAGERGARRAVVLTCAHAEMMATFHAVGFRSDRTERQLAIGRRGRPCQFSPDTSRWLVNFDWIDNGLRAPFLDQPGQDESPLSGAASVR